MARLFILNDFFVGLAARSPGLTPALLGQPRLNVVRDNPPARHLYRTRGWVQDSDYFMFHRSPRRG